MRLALRKMLPLLGGMTYRKRIINMSPIAYWPMNELAGTAAVNHGTLGTVANGTYGTGANAPTLAAAAAPGGGLCPSFDGGDFCNIYSATLNTGFVKTAGSVAIWCKVAEAANWTDGAAHVPYAISATTASYLLFDKPTNNTFRWRYKGVAEKNVSKTLSTTAWFHVTLTWNDAANQMIAYYNGAQEGVTQVDFGAWNASALLNTYCAIGANAITPIGGWKGNLAHAVLFGRTLTPAEVANLYNWGV